VEFPSQVNEIWAWQPDLIKQYARHHETGEPMPTELVETLIASRHFGQGFGYLESVAAAALDQAWHQAPASELPDSVDGVEAFERAALERWGVADDLVPPRYRSAYFHHIFGGGYAAGYYSYLWSEIMDADTVAWFEEHGGLSRDAGERFRRRLLARGGSIEAMATYRDFRGADPELRHLLERIGVGQE
jgi:peptidyl-dipeptidase Dcp